MIKGFYIILFFAVVIFAESCKNNDNVFPVVTSSFFNVVNASADTLNFYLNGTRQNNTASLVPASYSLYYPIPSGAEDIQFKKAGGFNILFSVPVKLIDSLNYSMYVTSAAASGAFTSIDTLNTIPFTDSGATVSQVRFVNASPSAGNLDVYVGDTVNFKSRSVKTTSVFLVTGSGIKTVKIYQSGTTAPLVDTSITFQQSTIYTLYSKGQLNGKGAAAFDVAVAVNLVYEE
jgi:hypothetical protein